MNHDAERDEDKIPETRFFEIGNLRNSIDLSLHYAELAIGVTVNYFSVDILFIVNRRVECPSSAYFCDVCNNTGYISWVHWFLYALKGVHHDE